MYAIRSYYGLEKETESDFPLIKVLVVFTTGEYGVVPELGTQKKSSRDVGVQTQADMSAAVGAVLGLYQGGVRTGVDDTGAEGEKA